MMVSLIKNYINKEGTDYGSYVKGASLSNIKKVWEDDIKYISLYVHTHHI